MSEFACPHSGVLTVYPNIRKSSARNVATRHIPVFTGFRSCPTRGYALSSPVPTSDGLVEEVAAASVQAKRSRGASTPEEGSRHVFGKPALVRSRAASPSTCHDTKASSLGLQTRAPAGGLNRSRSLQGYRGRLAQHSPLLTPRDRFAQDARCARSQWDDADH